MPVSERRAARTREILDATRALFDERGLRDAQIDDIAKAVGINRAIIYRHFSGKEELFAMTLVGYLDEVAARMEAAIDPTAEPPEQLAELAGAFMDFGHQYPAFVDCALALLRRRGTELMDEVSQDAMVRLGAAMNQPLGILGRVLKRGVASGDFHVDDPILTANVFYTQALGVLTLARLQLAVFEADPGTPRVDTVEFEKIREHLVQSAVLVAQHAPRPAHP